MRAAILLISVCFCIVAQTAIFEGTAVNIATGEPLSGVHVRLLSIGNQAIEGAYGAMSDRAGHFSIAEMPAGAYVLMAERIGYAHIPAKHSAPVMTLKAGQGLTDFRLEMAPRAVITGRVLDDAGDPLPFAALNLQPASADTNLDLMDQLGFARADDRGEFRISTGPGKYYLQASGAREFIDAGTVLSPTWYPDAGSKERALVIEAMAGREVAGIEIRMTAHRTVTIRGVVSGIPDQNRQGHTTVMMMRDRGSIGTGVAPDGTFVYQGLNAGTYHLFAQYATDKIELQSAPIEVNLQDADATGIQLALTPARQITGKLNITGEPPGTHRRERGTIHLEGMSMGAPVRADIDADGAFRITEALPVQYTLRVDGLGADGYVDVMRVDGQPVADMMLDFSRGVASEIEITAATNGGRISGRVVGDEGEPLNDPLIAVMLLRDGKVVHQENDVLHGSKFEFKALRPGKYRVFAFNPLDIIDMHADEEDLMKRLAGLGAQVEVKEGERITKDIKLMDKAKLYAR